MGWAHLLRESVHYGGTDRLHRRQRGCKPKIVPVVIRQGLRGAVVLFLKGAERPLQFLRRIVDGTPKRDYFNTITY